MPSNATGVPVTLDTVDPNGNYYRISDVTSDMTGAYGCAFTPQVPGTYQIIATFGGSKGYGLSSAITYVAVMDAAPTASLYPEVVLPSSEMYVIGTGIAIIVAAAIGGALIRLAIRKRP